MPQIELRDVSKSYGRDGAFHALQPTNLSVEEGEYVSIVGKSGSGKTTLLNLIAGLDHPSSGMVLVDGCDISRMRENRRARWRSRTLGIVFQFYQLLPTISALDNILLAMSLKSGRWARPDRERALGLLRLVGIEQHADRLPPTLSGGEQQRAAIARALANDPPLLLLDEPTGSIDSHATSEVLDLLDALHARSTTLVVISHDEAVAGRARRRITLSDGRLVSNEAQPR